MNNKTDLIRIIVFRVLELLIPLIAFSAVGTWLSVFRFITTQKAILLILIVLNVPYFMVVARRSKSLFYALRNKKVYLIINAVCVVLVAAIIYAVRYFASNEIFVWMFALTKLVYFLPFDIPLLISAAVFLVTLSIVIYLSPRRIEYMMKRSEPDEYDSFEEKQDVR